MTFGEQIYVTIIKEMAGRIIDATFHSSHEQYLLADHYLSTAVQIALDAERKYYFMREKRENPPPVRKGL